MYWYATMHSQQNIRNYKFTEKKCYNMIKDINKILVNIETNNRLENMNSANKNQFSWPDSVGVIKLQAAMFNGKAQETDYDASRSTSYILL
jgi:hypothetical protein